MDDERVLINSQAPAIPRNWQKSELISGGARERTHIPYVKTLTGDNVPASFSAMTSNQIAHNITIGQLNKLNLYPRIVNEHCESSRDVQAVISVGQIVGQIFKASKDNIAAISLTLESAAGVVIDDFESYADSAALQAVWVEGTNPAELEEVIVPSGSTKSMELPLDTTGDEWINTIPATDYTNYTGSFDHYIDNGVGLISVFIGDGTNTKSTLLPNTIGVWNHFDVAEVDMVEDQAGTTNILAITKIGFRVVTKRAAGLAYIDNLAGTPQPGSISIKLWDMGLTLPEDGVTSIDDGTQYTRIGASLASSFNLELVGGKRLYHIHRFTAGVGKNDPDNEVLNPDHYYILQLQYVDTNVSVYGPSVAYATAIGAPYYNNGYAFTVADEASVINKIGPYCDLMFMIYSSQAVYYTCAGWRIEGTPGEGAEAYMFIEDAGMIITDIIIDHEKHPSNEHNHSVENRPMLATDGSKLELYYNDDGSDDVNELYLEACFYYEPPIVNG